MLWNLARTGAGLMVALLFAAGAAQAQPGQPVVQLRSDFSVVVSYSAPVPPPAAGALLVATFNGAPFPGSPFNIGQATAVASPPLAPGTYTVQILWGAQASPVTAFTLSLDLGAPSLGPAGVDLNTVRLVWSAASGFVEGYDLEATGIETGQIYSAQLGPQTSLTVNGVFPGSYSVRIRARNRFAVGPWSNTISVVVGQFLASGDMQATLTWNTTADVDLHLVEPDLNHVYYGNMQGTSGRLDFDDVDGFGPENMFVASGRALPGVYQLYLVHAGQNVETTSTVALTLGVNSDSAQTRLFTRRTRRAEPRTAVMVALVDVLRGVVVEMVTPAGDQIEIDEALVTGALVSSAAKPQSPK